MNKKDTVVFDLDGTLLDTLEDLKNSVKKALNGVNLHLDPGDFVTIIGGNGAGKSTTLNMVAGVYPIDQGTIILDGKDISDLPEYKRAYMLGRVFQDPMMGTAAGMQIEENMAMPVSDLRIIVLLWMSFDLLVLSRAFVIFL